MKNLFSWTRCFSSPKPNDIENNDEENQENFRVFTYNELKAVTHGFHSSNKVGEGGFGTVYQGRLKDGSIVGVKVLSIELESMRGEREFIAELAALSDIRHENLVKLRGGEQNRIKFSWEARREISLGIASGLAYLHEEVQPHIVHRDIKASNILLDRNFTPKVGDFGLSKILLEHHSHISTRVAGTIGYLAPEYAITGRLTRKSDVYSFGVLLLEIVSGREVVFFDMEHGEHSLVQKAWEAYKSNKLIELVDSVLETNYPEDEAVRFIKVGLLCVQETARLRPGMSTAIKMLANEIDIGDIEICQPGVVTDFMSIKMDQQNSSQSVFSRGSTTAGSQSPYTSYF
ncbi:putative LRR receptor-like serine/threonine-protein kinase [Morus notabilis]|uniref:Putative LRR receptor-like serine/threonine-protein kinase n=1 Tax=Morus notabilis TaxID=981085 RepID=W9S564_9ROSA|nr:putative serine/threonine-protein kinase isoform X2 [Morus notabilis]EXC16228.1 putative LRR receptor-like serine/threonine-protein kinase [Morus notabilis]